MSTPALLQALAVEDEDIDIDQSAMTTEEDVLNWTSSVARRRVGGRLETAHFTVKEFLLSIDIQKRPEFSPYTILSNEPSIKIELSRKCLTFHQRHNVLSH
jgi:hypothetical protein